MGKKRNYVYWNIPVTKALNSAVESAVKTTYYVSKSDLVRDAVRRLLKEMGIQLH